jgi:hypothetical protein
MLGSFSTVITQGDLSAASTLADQMLDLAGRQGSPTTWGLAYACQVNACYFRGDLSGAEKHFKAGAAIFETSARKFPALLSAGFGLWKPRGMDAGLR